MTGSIRDLLSLKGNVVHCVERGARVADAVRMMRSHRIGSVLVTDGGDLCGIISEGDILRRIVSERRDPFETDVDEIMTTTLRTVTPATTVREAMAIVTEARCRHLPVLDEGEIVGLVSGGDLTAWMVRDLRLEIVDLIGYIHGPASEPPPPPFERAPRRASIFRGDAG